MRVVRHIRNSAIGVAGLINVEIGAEEPNTLNRSTLIFIFLLVFYGLYHFGRREVESDLIGETILFYVAIGFFATIYQIASHASDPIFVQGVKHTASPRYHDEVVGLLRLNRYQIYHSLTYTDINFVSLKRI